MASRAESGHASAEEQVGYYSRHEQISSGENSCCTLVARAPLRDRLGPKKRDRLHGSPKLSGPNHPALEAQALPATGGMAAAAQCSCAGPPAPPSAPRAVARIRLQRETTAPHAIRHDPQPGARITAQAPRRSHSKAADGTKQPDHTSSISSKVRLPCIPRHESLPGRRRRTRVPVR